jgi:uncharacterized protein (UPF0332 family)
VLDKHKIIQYRIQKAWDTYGDAKQLVESNRYFSILNRIYYASFYMVVALLLTKNLSSSKHSGVKSLFNKHFVNQGLFDKKWGTFYSVLFLNRQEADYADLSTISQDSIILNFKLAFEFLTEIETYINQKSE